MNAKWSSHFMGVSPRSQRGTGKQLASSAFQTRNILRLPVHDAFLFVKHSARSAARRPWLYLHDIFICAGSYFLSNFLLFSSNGVVLSGSQIQRLSVSAVVYVLICGAIFPILGLYMRSWRYASLPDFLAIPKAALVSSAVFALILLTMKESISPPPASAFIEALVLTPALAAIRLRARLSGRLRRYANSGNASAKANFVPILLIGAGHSADLFLRALQGDTNSQYWPVGILDPRPDEQDLLFRGVPVLGTLDQIDTVIQVLDVRNQRPRHIIFSENLVRYHNDSVSKIIAHAESLGIAVSRLPSPTELRQATRESEIELRRIELPDLLERPQAALDRDAIRRFVAGRKVLITGAGGSIGGELARQVALLSPSELILLDQCEYNLYAIDLDLSEKATSVVRHCYLCNVREAARVNDIFDRHHPEIVFHVAALKHVPMVELNPCEGVLTNIVGTQNIADATHRSGALAMVQVSTDKVVNPTSFMGATKRVAELYCQALDLENGSIGGHTRFMTVRFGNVLGSSGSLIPLFQRQLTRGGPLTVTHPEMTRYFMTIREAVELTLHATARGLEDCLGSGQIFVLDMGKPIKIMEVARRMIRLAGYCPDKEIKIEIIGCRPGEKMYEELFDADESRVESPIAGVFGAVPRPIPLPVLRDAVDRLGHSAKIGDVSEVLKVICELIPKYICQNTIRSEATESSKQHGRNDSARYLPQEASSA